jgi:hypothetical protein
MSTTDRKPMWKRVGTSLVIVALTMAGLLIWARLRLVTGIPRTALAEPKPMQAEPGKNAQAHVEPAAGK